MNIPDNLRYTEDHEWIKADENHVLVGITDFAQGELGDIVYVDIETEGEELSKGKVFGTVEAVKTVSDLFMPVSGIIEEVNPELEDAPEMVNRDAYGNGWMVKIRLSNKEEIDGLLDAEQYKALVGS